MCITFFAFGKDVQQATGGPLILLSNRDEFLARPTDRLRVWEDKTNIVGGRDRVRGGTWLGVCRQSSRFAVLTNIRVAPSSAAISGKKSRGELVTDYLTTNVSPLDYLNALDKVREDYGASNLIVGRVLDDHSVEIAYSCNHEQSGPTQPIILPPGIYGVGNAHILYPLKKVERGRQFLARKLGLPPPPAQSALVKSLWSSLSAPVSMSVEQIVEVKPSRCDEEEHERLSGDALIAADFNERKAKDLPAFHSDLLDILSDCSPEIDHTKLIPSGIDVAIEFKLSTIFVPHFHFILDESIPKVAGNSHDVSPSPHLVKFRYGTRTCSTLRFTQKGHIEFSEMYFCMNRKTWDCTYFQHRTGLRSSMSKTIS